MSKKPAGPKESQLRKMREGNVDATDVLKGIEEEEQLAREEFERKLREQREKKLAAQIEPLEKHREELQGQMREIQDRLDDIDRDLDKLRGRDGRARRGAGGAAKGGKRFTAEERLDIGRRVHDWLKGKAAVPSSDIIKGLSLTTKDGREMSSTLLRQIKDQWNEANKDQKIQVTGEKAAARWHL